MRVRNPDTRDELADAFLHSTGADIREGHGEAFYVPSRDFISMPAFEAFKGADHFYNVAFHEVTHNAERRVMPRRSVFPFEMRSDRRGDAA
jgi:antirestriction protein ArdC